MSAHPDRIGIALTGYVDDDVADRMCTNGRPPIAGRSIDVGYRARDLPAYYGKFGRMKADIGRMFISRARDTGLSLDISCDPGDVLIGDAWTRFLLESKCSLGCESGSSLLDETGEIRDAVDAYVACHPAATFDEIEAQVFPGQDNRYLFNSVSPRLFEAAIFGSCQILVEGGYLPELHAGKNYVALRRDCSNLRDVFDVVRDPRAIQEIADACFEALIVSPRYRYSQRVADVFARIGLIRASRGLRDSDQAASSTKFERSMQLHQHACAQVSLLYSEQYQREREYAILRIQSPWWRFYRPVPARLRLAGVRADIRKLGFPLQPPRHG